MSDAKFNGRVMGVDALQHGRGYSTTLHVDVLALPSDFPDHYGEREVEITFKKTPGEIAQEAYRKQAESDGHGFYGAREFEGLPPYARARWDAVAAAVLGAKR